MKKRKNFKFFGVDAKMKERNDQSQRGIMGNKNWSGNYVTGFKGDQ